MSLGTFHHDFPRLAKQSGFFFQLHKGKVNWAEIENLSLNDIIENRNFQLLEQNLVNVVNCNLEKEYDLKILDQNFVKLFKLAQLGVDYLSYCETYLDKCVIILQQQLVAFQEECQSLKSEKQKRKEEANQGKRKTKTQSYQCEKCDKAFISDVYLKFHDKRRHSSPNTPKSSERSPKKSIDNYQQTENESKTSTSTQTVPPNDRSTITQNEEDADKIKAHHAVKIENLEQEIQLLKDRLRKAENALTDQIEASKSSSCHSPFSGPMHHNTMLLLFPSHQTLPGSGYQEVSPGYLVPAPEILQANCSLIQLPPTTKAVESNSPPENSCQASLPLEKTSHKKTSNLQEEEIKLSASSVEDVENCGKYKRETKECLECDKENVNPNNEKPAKALIRPRPPPRKSKKLTPTRLGTESCKVVEVPGAPKGMTQSKSESEDFMSPITVRSTPIKERSAVQSNVDICEELAEHVSEICKRQSTSNESVDSRKKDLAVDEPVSLLKAIVGRRSPKFRIFRRNLRRSLTSLCESVSPTSKELSKEPVDVTAKAAVVEGLNGELRQLGVDPEWSGIPKKTMKQKLKILKQRRKILTKENPLYPVIRQNVEEKIFQKLRKNFENKKTNLVKQLSKESLSSTEDTGTREPVLKDETEGAKSQKCVMYDIESDSESKSSNSEVNFDEKVVQNGSRSGVESGGERNEKEFDLTVFQVGRGSFNKVKENDVSVKVEELLTDSDAEIDLSTEKKLNRLKSFLIDKGGEEIRQDEDEDRRLGFSVPREDKHENQSILKSDGFQSKLQLNAKKKVWFRNFSNDVEEGLSDSPTDDWSFKSDWEKDVS